MLKNIFSGKFRSIQSHLSWTSAIKGRGEEARKIQIMKWIKRAEVGIYKKTKKHAKKHQESYQEKKKENTLSTKKAIKKKKKNYNGQNKK